MKTTLIMLPQPILVSDEEANAHDAIWDCVNSQVTVLRQSYGLTNYMKIIAGLPDLPKLDLSLIAERIGWVDVEKLADKFFESWSLGDGKQSSYELFRKVYKFSQSLNEKKYSLEDMRKCYAQGIADSNEYMFLEKSGREFFEDYIHSLSKPKEYQVEVEMEVNQCDGCISGHPIVDGIHVVPYSSGSMVCKKHLYDRPKITNNTIKVLKVL